MAAYNTITSRFEDYKAKKGIDVMSREALNWFYNYANRLVKTSSFSRTLSAGQVTTRPIPGKFYLYQYDPKTKEKMPYYDTMPLVLVTDVTEDGWYGINFHYMPPAARLRIMEGLYSTIKNKAVNDNLKIKINWQKAKSIAKAASSNQFLQHSIKRYLSNYIASPLIELSPEYWALCVFLPLSRFKKKSDSFIWKNV